MAESGDSHQIQSELGDDRAITSRRGVLDKGIKLAVTLPVVLAALQGGVAQADAEGPKHGDPAGHPPSPPDRPGPRRPPFWPAARFAVTLSPVSQVPSSDFVPTNPGNNPLRIGALWVLHGQSDSDNDADDQNSGRVMVQLEGASPNTAYDVTFARFNDHGREDLGVITTNAAGNVHGATPNRLAGTNRIGIFVLTSNGQDQFVSCIPVLPS